MGLSRWPRRVAGASVVVALGVSACGASSPHNHVPYGHLSGNVEVCGPPGPTKCSVVDELVTLHFVRGTRIAGPTASQRTVAGRFSFSVPPGTYFPSASPGPPLQRGCISGEAVVRSSETQIDNIRCFERISHRN